MWLLYIDKFQTWIRKQDKCTLQAVYDVIDTIRLWQGAGKVWPTTGSAMVSRLGKSLYRHPVRAWLRDLLRAPRRTHRKPFLGTKQHARASNTTIEIRKRAIIIWTPERGNREVVQCRRWQARPFFRFVSSLTFRGDKEASQFGNLATFSMWIRPRVLGSSTDSLTRRWKRQVQRLRIFTCYTIYNANTMKLLYWNCIQYMLLK